MLGTHSDEVQRVRPTGRCERAGTVDQHLGRLHGLSGLAEFQEHKTYVQILA
jgi:hypothetical protein